MQRIADRIRQEISVLLIREINDPRLHQVYITDVRVDRELAYADVYASAVEGASRSKEIIAGLVSAGGFMRRLLAERVELRAFPRLRFHWDPTPENADRIEQLLAQIRAESHPAEPPRVIKPKKKAAKTVTTPKKTSKTKAGKTG
jgi:ribosome-binding factor A